MPRCPQWDYHGIQPGGIDLEERHCVVILNNVPVSHRLYTVVHEYRYLLESCGEGHGLRVGAMLGGCGGPQQRHVFPTER